MPRRGSRRVGRYFSACAWWGIYKKIRPVGTIGKPGGGAGCATDGRRQRVASALPSVPMGRKPLLTADPFFSSPGTAQALSTCLLSGCPSGAKTAGFPLLSIIPPGLPLRGKDTYPRYLPALRPSLRGKGSSTRHPSLVAFFRMWHLWHFKDFPQCGPGRAVTAHAVHAAARRGGRGA